MVEQKPMPSTLPRRKASAVMRREGLVRRRGVVERWTALLILICSLVGTVVALNGGWANVLAGNLSFGGVVAGIALQAALTWMQWAYGDRKPHLLYLVPLGIDAALTTYGFGPLIAPSLEAWMVARAWPEPVLVSWLIVGIAALGVAWYPESRLID